MVLFYHRAGYESILCARMRDVHEGLAAQKAKRNDSLSVLDKQPSVSYNVNCCVVQVMLMKQFRDIFRRLKHGYLIRVRTHCGARHGCSPQVNRNYCQTRTVIKMNAKDTVEHETIR